MTDGFSTHSHGFFCLPRYSFMHLKFSVGKRLKKKQKADRTKIMCLHVVSSFQLPCKFITKLKE